MVRVAGAAGCAYLPTLSRLALQAPQALNIGEDAVELVLSDNAEVVSGLTDRVMELARHSRHQTAAYVKAWDVDSARRADAADHVPDSLALGLWFDSSSDGDLRDALDWSINHMARHLDVPAYLRQPELQYAGRATEPYASAWTTETRDEPLGSILALELAALFGLTSICEREWQGSMPVLLTGVPENLGAAPVFDFTHRGAQRLLDVAGNSIPEQLAEALTRSQRAKLVPSHQAVEGAVRAFAASVQLHMLSHASAVGTPPAAVKFTLIARSDQLVIDRFFQTRYAPVQFGKSLRASNQLATGHYGFQAWTVGPNAPLIDAAVHAVSPTNTKGHAVNF